MTVAQRTLRAWIYARRSRDQQTRASITDQKDRGREACDEHGWDLAGTIDQDEGRSASRFAKRTRPGWQELLDTLRAGLIDVLVLWESNRGDRTLTSWSAFLDLCRERRVLIFVVSHDRLYDMGNPRDWKTLAEDGVSSAHFSEQLSVDIKRGKAGARKRGRPSGQTPYGYQVHYNPQTSLTAGWLIVPGQAAVVTEIITSIGDHMPVRVIERSLNERGIPARNGGKWSTTEIRYIARNPAYAGLVRLPDGTLVGRQPQADGAEWPPIVSREAWEKAVTVLGSRITGPRPGGVKHLMSYLAQCECGGMLKSGPRNTYVCSAHDLNVPEDWLDEIVADRICIRLARPGARDLYTVDDDSRSIRLKSDVTALRERRDKFRKMAAKGQIEPDALADIEAELSPEIARKERELGSIRVVPALADILAVEDTRAAWEGYTVQARREIVAAVTGVCVLRVPRTAPLAKRRDVHRVVTDWQPQPAKKRPGGRPGLALRPSLPDSGPNTKWTWMDLDGLGWTWMDWD